MSGYAEPDCSVFVGNLDSRVTEEILWELFVQSGPLENVRIPTDKETGKNRAFGFVEFTSPVSVAYATQLLDGVQLYGRPIAVKPQQRNNAGSPSVQNMNQTPPNRHSSPVYSPDMRQNGRDSPNYPGYPEQLQHSFSHPGNRPSWPQHNVPGMRPPLMVSPLMFMNMAGRATPPFIDRQPYNPSSYPRRQDSYNR